MTAVRIDIEEAARLRAENDRLHRLLNEYQMAAYAQVRANRRRREYRQAHSMRARIGRALDFGQRVSEGTWKLLDALPQSAAIMLSGIIGMTIAATIIMTIARCNV